MRPRRPKPGQRVHDWETALHAWLADVAERQHEYGRHDCMLFVAGAVKAVTGKDYGRGHRGRYASPLGAARYLKRCGFSSPEAWIGSLLPEKPIGFAQRGDIVLDAEGIPGVCIGPEALFVGPENIVRQPREAWVKAWAVGAPPPSSGRPYSKTLRAKP